MTRQMADDEVLRVLGLAILAARRGSHVSADDLAEARAAVAALQAERDALRDGGGAPRVVDALHLSTGRLVTAKEVESLQATNLDGWTLAISRGVQLDEATAALEALRGQVEGLVAEYRPSMDDETLHSWAQDVVELLAIKERMG